MEKRTGVLKVWFPAPRMFGFITSFDGGKPEKFYFHASQTLSGKPGVGATVRFAVSPIRTGELPSAVEVELDGGAQ
jgi:hypothetical protein